MNDDDDFHINFLFWHFLSFAQKQKRKNYESIYEYNILNIANNLIISYSKLYLRSLE